MTLYLKYRPKSIEELDLPSAREQLEKILKSKNFPHAFLFSGPRGTGKTSAARIVATNINKLKDTTSPDIVELDAASNRGIDEVRILREQVALLPLSAKFKVYIIDEAHMLTTEASNALLKTLEEPPSHAVFILCTTDPQKLPETIVSRCTQIQFTSPNPEEIVAKLKLVAKGEKYKVSDTDLDLIASEAKGSFRDGIKILEQVMTTGIVPQAHNPEGFIALLRSQNTKDSLKYIDDLVTNGVNLRSFIEKCVETLRIELLKTLDKNILNEIENFEKAYEQTKTTAVSPLPLEMMVISMSKSQVPNPKEISISKTTNDNQLSPMTTNDIQAVLDKWPEILRVVRPFNHSVEGLLRSTRPLTYDGKTLTLEVFYKFHKDKLSEEKCRTIVEDCVATVLGAPRIVLSLVLGKSKPQEDLAKVAESIFK